MQVRVFAASLAVLVVSALAPFAAWAAAPGLNLSWETCGLTPATADHAGSCAPGDTPPPLVVSFRVAQPLPDFVAAAIVIDIGIDANEIPPWFQWRTGGRREGAFHPVTVDAIAGCANPYAGDVPFGGFVIQDSPSIPGRHVQRIRADWARTTSARPISPDSLYVALILAIDADSTWERQARPQGTPGYGVTPGCAAAACFVLNSIEVFGFETGWWTTIEQADVRGWVTWRGSPEMSLPCPAALPARRSTWGALKSAYR